MFFRKKILLIGGGGHCKSCIEVIESEKRLKIFAIVDVKENIGKKVLDYPIIADDTQIEQLLRISNNVLITIGFVKNNIKRVELYEKIKSIGGVFPVIIAPSSYVSRKSYINEGTIIMHQAFINSNVEVGYNCIINTKALIEHDVVIGNNTHIATGAVINGGCNIGDNCLIGSGSLIINGLNICSNVIVGAGSVVTKDIVESGVYVGVPARRVK